MIKIPDGYCHCGCGQKTPLAKRTRNERGYKKGEPQRYIKGHLTKKFKNDPEFEYKKFFNHGYVQVLRDGNKTATYANYIKEHIKIVEQVLGKSLPPNAVIHHRDGNRANNKNNNLVVCQDSAYHLLIHKRTRAHKACGHANWRKCSICQEYDNPSNMYITPNNWGVWHRACHRKRYREEIKRQTGRIVKCRKP